MRSAISISTNDSCFYADAQVICEGIIPNALKSLDHLAERRDTLDAVIAGMLAERDRLDAEEGRLETMVSRSRGLLCAFPRFPVEVLIEIFEWHCANYEVEVLDIRAGP